MYKEFKIILNIVLDYFAHNFCIIYNVLFVSMPTFGLLTNWLFQSVLSIMYSVFNQLVFLYLCLECICLLKGHVLFGEIALKINHY